MEGNTYLNSEFLLTLPSVDHITNRICKLGKGCKIYKTVYKHLSPIGYRNRSTIFQRLSDAVRHIMKKTHKVTHDIDDIVGFDVNYKVEQSVQDLFLTLDDGRGLL